MRRLFTIIGYNNKDNIYYFEGEILGEIVSPKGSGFGWDSIFKPKGYNKTFGEMDKIEKNQISMRNIALQKLKDHLNINNNL